jgi:hypothetical protein
MCTTHCHPELVRQRAGSAAVPSVPEQLCGRSSTPTDPAPWDRFGGFSSL